jgi:hypothetical protein
MITKLQSYGVAAIVALCCSLNLNAQGYSDSDIRRIGSNRDSSSSTASNLTVTSSSNTRINDVSIIFVGQSDSRSLDNRKPSSSMYRMTREGHEASFSDVNLQTYYYVHTSNGSKSFNFGSHKKGFIYLVTLRNVDLNALRGLRADRSSDYRWTMPIPIAGMAEICGEAVVVVVVTGGLPMLTKKYGLIIKGCRLQQLCMMTILLISEFTKAVPQIQEL